MGAKSLEPSLSPPLLAEVFMNRGTNIMWLNLYIGILFPEDTCRNTGIIMKIWFCKYHLRNNSSFEIAIYWFLSSKGELASFNLRRMSHLFPLPLISSLHLILLRTTSTILHLLTWFSLDIQKLTYVCVLRCSRQSGGTSSKHKTYDTYIRT